MRADGTVKVLDFGPGQSDDTGIGSLPSVSMPPTLTSLAVTEAGMILGNGGLHGARADTWEGCRPARGHLAFGVVLYEIVTGQRLFGGETARDVIAAVLTKAPDLSAVPKTWRPLIGRCLDKRGPSGVLGTNTRRRRDRDDDDRGCDSTVE